MDLSAHLWVCEGVEGVLRPGVPFLMTSDLGLGVPDVSLVSGLERWGGVPTQEATGALWEGRKLVGCEQF